MNISDGVEWGRYRFPDKVAVVGDDGARLTYQELDESANRIGRFLRDVYGVKPGERVGILAGNTIRSIEAFYGIVRAGCIAVPLNDRWSPLELDACLSNCRPALILTDCSEDGRALGALTLTLSHSCGSGRGNFLSPAVPGGPIATLAHSGGRGDSHPSCRRHGKRSPCPVGKGEGAEMGPGPTAGPFFAELEASPLPDRPRSEDFFYIGYTSGSTGRPKGVLRRHRSWLDSYFAATVEFGSGRDDRVLVPGSLFYSLSLFAVTHALFLGSTVYIMSDFDPRKMVEIVEREKVTTLCMAPTLYQAVLDLRGAARRDLSSVRTLICAGSSWPRAKEAKAQVLDLFPWAGLYEYYGAAETSFVSVSPPEDQLRRPRSAGRPFLGVQVEIRGDDGRRLGPGEVGLLYARSSFGFEGYYGDPERTATALQDGWMTVGDLAYAGEDGYLYIVGRRDNVVITGGVNVSVEEVEEVLNSHPQVFLAAVFGVDDELRGQALVALIQKREGAVLGRRELRAYCAARLDRHKVPRRLRFVDSLPLTSAGKVSRFELPRMFSGASPAGASSRQ